MKGKIIAEQYNPGYDSWILKQTKYGLFDGYVQLDEEDLDIDNSFDGCRIAEFDADTKSDKERAKWFNQRAYGARILFDNVKTSLTEEELEQYQLILEKMERQVNYLTKEARQAKERYENRLAYRPMRINSIIKGRREIRKKKK